MDFSNLGPATAAMMGDLLATLEREIGDELQPSQTPQDVRSFEGPQGNSRGSIVMRAGTDRSKIDTVLVSWLQCTLPFGTLRFATLSMLMGPGTDTPHLLFEFPIGGPKLLTVVMDLLPRRDLALDAEYLERFYESSELHKLRQQLDGEERLLLYTPATLYIRAATSPVALMYTAAPPSGGHGQGAADAGLVEPLISDIVHPTASRALDAWIDAYRNRSRVVLDEPERESLRARDASVKRNGIEVDLTSNLPRLFGQDVTDRVLQAVRTGL
eukprot:SM000154S01424  [mRNA]  locus=s154:250613:251885:- [translate_table: standard]